MVINLSHIVLEDEQKELLDILVETARNTARENRRKFVVIRTVQGDLLSHPTFNEKKEIYFGDIEILSNNGLINLTLDNRTYVFDVSPIGFKYYDYAKNKYQNSNIRIEDSIQTYLHFPEFQNKYSEAYIKWQEAEKLLWASESNNQYTMIGHLCREAMHNFINHLIEKYKIENADPDKTKTISRFRLIIENQTTQKSKSVLFLLEALLAYWGTLSDLVQKQEHGGQLEGEQLIWEDGRRIVFQTMVVMYEIDRALK